MRILLALLALILFGCATPYQKSGFEGGYSEAQLGENLFQVSFRGNGYTGLERITDFTLLRSAEVTLKNGFKYFVIVESDRKSKDYTRKTPTRSRTTGSMFSIGDYSNIETTTTTSGGDSYTVSKYRITNIIVCYKDKPEIEELVFTAEFVNKSIRQKYDLKP
ncbi:MAG: hypothetical protein GY874_09315 [Desulfobacteraceae bacterium]|nr:hypothetical protein [Desulfobacteraceae bacterium]